MSELESLMREWLTDPDPARRLHAANRIAIGFGEPIEPQGPGLLTKAANFAGAVATHLAAGMPTASPEQKAARLAVCEPCPQRLSGGSCAGCGCNLEWKASWLDQDCPESKWPKP